MNPKRSPSEMPTGVYQRKQGLTRRKKLYPLELVECVRAAYWDKNLTQEETAAALGISVHVVVLVMQRHGIPRRPAWHVRFDYSGPQNPGWKGEQATYSALHYRVYRARGLPKECSVCGTTDPSKYYDWANLSGNYADVNDYARMCRSCHIKHDRARRAA